MGDGSIYNRGIYSGGNYKNGGQGYRSRGHGGGRGINDSRHSGNGGAYRGQGNPPAPPTPRTDRDISAVIRPTTTEVCWYA